MRAAEVFPVRRRIDAIAVGEVAHSEGPGEGVAAGVIADRADVGVVGAAQQSKQPMDERTGAARQAARGSANDRPGISRFTQRQHLAGDKLQGLVPGDRLEA